jgi:hypothetical protein
LLTDNPIIGVIEDIATKNFIFLFRVPFQSQEKPVNKRDAGNGSLTHVLVSAPLLRRRLIRSVQF